MMLVMNPLWWLGIHDDGDESVVLMMMNPLCWLGIHDDGDESMDDD